MCFSRAEHSVVMENKPVICDFFGIFTRTPIPFRTPFFFFLFFITREWGTGLVLDLIQKRKQTILRCQAECLPAVATARRSLSRYITSWELFQKGMHMSFSWKRVSPGNSGLRGLNHYLKQLITSVWAHFVLEMQCSFKKKSFERSEKFVVGVICLIYLVFDYTNGQIKVFRVQTFQTCFKFIERLNTHHSFRKKIRRRDV